MLAQRTNQSAMCGNGRAVAIRPAPGAVTPFKNVKRVLHLSQRQGRPDVSCLASKAKFFVGGNWKCNGSQSSVTDLVKGLNAGSIPSTTEVVVSPTYIHLGYVKSNLDSSKYDVAAQNCWLKGNGAYTGEISAEMLKDSDINWVILGHSERRTLNGESNEVVGKKCAHALEVGLSVIACIGETLEQRNSGKVFSVLDGQMQALVDNITDWSKVVVAYEPVWAIGTGVVASPQQAQEVHAYLRKWLTEKLGENVASTLRIIYGGSVNDDNCSELGHQEDIDGFLVGGASLKANAFLKICNAQH